MVRQKSRRTRTGYLVGMDTAGVPLHAYPRCTRFSPKKKFSVLVWYRSGTGWVRSGMGRDKTKPKRCRFRVNLKPYLSSPPNSQPLVLFSATRFSLFSALDSLSLTSSLHRWCTRFSLSHFLTLLVTSDETEGAGRSDCGSEDLRRVGNPRTSLIVDLIVVFSDFFSHFGYDCSNCGISLWYFC